MEHILSEMENAHVSGDINTSVHKHLHEIHNSREHVIESALVREQTTESTDSHHELPPCFCMGMFNDRLGKSGL